MYKCSKGKVGKAPSGMWTHEFGDGHFLLPLVGVTWYFPLSEMIFKNRRNLWRDCSWRLNTNCHKSYFLNRNFFSSRVPETNGNTFSEFGRRLWSPIGISDLSPAVNGLNWLGTYSMKILLTVILTSFLVNYSSAWDP